MAHWVKFLLCKCKDLSLDLSTHPFGMIPTGIPGLGGVKKGAWKFIADCWDCCLDSW